MKKLLIIFLSTIALILVVLVNFSSTGNVAYDMDEIVLPVVVHLVDDGTVQFATDRDIGDIYRLFDEVNGIWSQAKIRFIVEDVKEFEVNNKEFSDVFFGDLDAIIKAENFEGGKLNVFFARYISSNGVAFPAQGAMIIADITTVNDYRATAHELGHLLGLRHIDAKDQLMASGVNGEILSIREIEFARRNARRVYEVTSTL